MTIALGILATDGVVLAADSEESYGYLKGSQSKIVGVFGRVPFGSVVAAPLDQRVCGITGAGNGAYIDTAAEGLGDIFLHNPTLNAPELQAEFGKYIKTFHENHVLPFVGYPPDDQPVLDMLVGVQLGITPQLYATHKSTIRSVAPYAAIGLGAAYAKILLDLFWDRTGADETRILAAYTVFRVKEMIDTCGKYTTVLTLHGPRTVSDAGGSKLVPPDRQMSYLEDVERLEWLFRRNYAGEKKLLWRLIRKRRGWRTAGL